MDVKLAIVFTNFFLLLFGQAASVDAMLAIVFTDIFLLFLLVQVCLRVPPVVADEAKLAIVFTYFFSFSSSSFDPLRGISHA